jgi:PAS domain S-box-containing protein
MERPKILVVEDEQIVATELKERLHALGYLVAGSASTGPEAIAKTESSNPDLILMDIRLRGEMDGIDAAGRILASRDVPIVFVTAHADEATLERAKVTGPMGYVLKPFSERELQTAIEIGLYKHAMEKKLREQKQWLAAMLDSIADAVIATDTEGHITLINPAASSLTGFAHMEALGRHVTSLLNIVNEATKTTMENPVTMILDPGAELLTTNYSLVIIAKSGKVVPIDGSASRIMDERGKRQGAIFAFRDVTAQSKQAEAARLVQFSINQAPDLILQIGSDGLILEANAATCDTLGFAKDELLSKHAYELEVYSSQPQWTQLWERAGKERVLTYETSYWTRDGAALPVDVRACYIRFVRQEFLFIIARVTAQAEGLMRGDERSTPRAHSI